jgi:hypothetical protein
MNVKALQEEAKKKLYAMQQAQVKYTSIISSLELQPVGLDEDEEMEDLQVFDESHLQEFDKKEMEAAIQRLEGRTVL